MYWKGNIASKTTRKFRSLIIGLLMICLLLTPALPQSSNIRNYRGAQGEEALKKLHETIARSGKLPGGKAYWDRSRSLYNRPTASRPANRIAKRASALSRSVEVGQHPEGFGKGFFWDRKDAEILLALFINGADPLGVSIGGIEAGDRVTIGSASGLASFTKDTGNPLASSIVALVAAGAEVGATAAGVPEAAPLVKAAEKFAQEQFKPTNAKHKVRDAFGVDPSNGGLAEQEGGILVCLPEDNGTYYSGNDDHKDRWIQGGGYRSDKNRPKHIQHAFFPIRDKFSHNSRVVRGSGEIYVLAWDHAFEDNAGFYKVFLHIKRGTPPSNPPVIK